MSLALKPLQVIVASTQKGGIGQDGAMPWPRLTLDLQFFLRKTTENSQPGQQQQNAVIMGRKTYDSLPEKKRPLPGRINVVLSRNMPPGLTKAENGALLYVAPTFEAALAAIDSSDILGPLICGAFVIGGAELYALALASPRCTKVFLTSILREFPCDRFFPRSDLAALFDLEDVGEVQTEALVPFQFQTWTRRPGIELPVSADGLLEGRAHVYDVTPPPSTSPTKGKVHEEQKYLDLVREVIETGTQVIDRTLVGTRFVFGRDLRFSLRDGKLPLYTTKRVPVKTMLIELVWMLKGQTCSEILRRQGCNIWNDNGSRAFLDKYGFHDRRVGDLGPVYGFQWRHWGAKYIDADTSYAGQGIDQVQILLNKIRENNPSDRRMLISAWNVSDLAKMALPPCHYSMEWAVDAGRGELSCKVNMRSNDLGLGNPFNVAGYSCLVALVAHLTGYRPGELILSIGNAHVYLNHIEALQEQLTRTPGDFPTLKIREGITDIDQVSVDDFVISGYSPQGTLKMKMAV